MISVEKVSKRYRKKEILKDANLVIDKYGVYLIKGESGVGKTTLLNIISKLTNYKGKVRNDYLNNMSYSFQNSYLIKHMSIRENLDLYDINYNVLEKYNLLDKLDFYSDSLSKGERQRISFIMAIYSNCKLILLDEPFANLNEEYHKIMLEDLIDIKENKIILFVSHKYDNYLDLFDGIIEIRDKKISLDLKGGYKIRETKSKTFRLNNKYLLKEWLYYKKDNLRVYLLILLCFLIPFIFSVGVQIVKREIDRDISYNLTYNKHYLKSCKESINNGFIINKCSNPSSSEIELLNKHGIKYGFNYDYLLNNLYSRADLQVISKKNITLKEGEYPRKYNEVITSDDYNLGDIISLDANLIILDKEIDLYDEDINLKVVGIYNDLKFKKDNYIYLDYDLIDSYYKNEYLLNNKYSLYNYYNSLDIAKYKYIAFEDDFSLLESDNDSYQYYDYLKDLVNKIVSFLRYIVIFILVFLIYNIYRFNKSRLLSRKETYAYLISNCLSKYVYLSLFKIDILVILFLFVLLFLISLIFSIDIFVYFIAMFLIIIILVFQCLIIFRRRNIFNLLRK